MKLKLTLEDFINDIGEIPYCKCKCGDKVNIKIDRGSYNQYKRKGYPQFITGHNTKIEHPFLGKHHTPETIELIKLTRSKQVFSEEQKEKQRQSVLRGKDHPMYGKIGELSPSFGKKRTKEQREKMSGEKYPLYGKKHKPESIEKMKQNHYDCSGENNPQFGIIPKSGGRSRIYYYLSLIQGIVPLKGTFELAYAEYLDQHNILWYYEPMTFPLTININGAEKQTTYTPDFYLPETNKFIDTKGYMKIESELKIRKFREKYSYYLQILFHGDLLNLGIDLKYYEKCRKKYSKDEIYYENSLQL